MTSTQILILMAALQFKHFICDGLLQTKAMVISKAHYGRGQGVLHAFLHGLGTEIVVLLCGASVGLAVAIGLLDMLIHYHIDYTKENLVGDMNWTSTDRYFWWAISADQMLHQFTYIGFVWLVITNASYLQ